MNENHEPRNLPETRLADVQMIQKLPRSSRISKCEIPEMQGVVTIKEYDPRLHNDSQEIFREFVNIRAVNYHYLHYLQRLVVDDEERFCGVITDYMPKGSLGDYVFGFKEGYGNHITAKRILLWFKQLADVLAHCHGKNIIHRNITPNKMLLNDDFGSIRLTDFSLSRVIAREMTNRTGCHPYTAPEVLVSGEYSTKCDVYSFGMSLYACINKGRKSPFQDELENSNNWRLNAFRDYLNQGNRPPIQTIGIADMFGDEQKRQLECLIIRCWSQNASERPTMAEVHQCMEAIGKIRANNMEE